MSQADLLDQFKQATDGLIVISESDYPIEVLQWQVTPPLTTSKLLELADKPADSPVERVEVAAFFAPMTRQQDWHGAAEEAIVQRFRALVKLIADTLSEVQVYRVGRVAIEVYIVGKIAENPLDNDIRIALATQVIET